MLGCAQHWQAGGGAWWGSASGTLQQCELAWAVEVEVKASSREEEAAVQQEEWCRHPCAAATPQVAWSVLVTAVTQPVHTCGHRWLGC